ncbi:hypothetical protein QBC34DRAFT_416562 [Podospora aff. communis PSN243]|uniref:Uncharacterized protein n=1 Tax=Podospora aff. communis PSN243 TaxID=3040156 RepID=A0AAV9G566_9PEZI|nr:hypothetical protein QBC34DRAFT_416562 [Podospora aff. communis PSN243]
MSHNNDNHRRGGKQGYGHGANNRRVSGNRHNNPEAISSYAEAKENVNKGKRDVAVYHLARDYESKNIAPVDSSKFFNVLHKPPLSFPRVERFQKVTPKTVDYRHVKLDMKNLVFTARDADGNPLPRGTPTKTIRPDRAVAGTMPVQDWVDTLTGTYSPTEHGMQTLVTGVMVHSKHTEEAYQRLVIEHNATRARQVQELLLKKFKNVPRRSAPGALSHDLTRPLSSRVRMPSPTGSVRTVDSEGAKRFMEGGDRGRVNKGGFNKPKAGLSRAEVWRRQKRAAEEATGSGIPGEPDERGDYDLEQAADARVQKNAAGHWQQTQGQDEYGVDMEDHVSMDVDREATPVQRDLDIVVQEE